MSDARELESDRLVRDPAEQRNHWRLERGAWALMGMAILAALLGLLGPGPLTRAVATDPEGRLVVEHPRLLHMGSSFDVRFVLRAPPGADRVSLSISDAYLDSVHVESIVPEPRFTETGRGEVTFHFAIAGGADRVPVRFRLDASRPGGVAGVARLGDVSASIRQFVFP